jgi:hypothetical protein
MSSAVLALFPLAIFAEPGYRRALNPTWEAT